MQNSFSVLIVDDAKFTRDLVRKGMRAVFPGFKCDEAADGLIAQRMLEKKHYDLVLCDWEMPNMNGAELLGWIRANTPISKLAFIMITSRGDKAHVVKAIELGVNNYIVKPFNNEKLGKVVSSVIVKSSGMSAEQLCIVAGKGSGGEPIAGFQATQGLSGAIPAATFTPVEVANSARGLTSVTPKEKVIINLRFADFTVPLLIQELSLQKMVGIMRRDDKIPAILDLVVTDMAVTTDDIARLNAFVHTLQAREASVEAEFINITLHLIDQDDPDKVAFLKRFMASIA